jgi:sugar phosphate isomerase/epimerase
VLGFDVFAIHRVSLALETGQENAACLSAALEELADMRIGVNFDPANMILYGAGEPVPAFRALAPWVRQAHLKDAVTPSAAGQWGRETIIGEGAVDWPAFLCAVQSLTPRAPLMIEREAGGQRVLDIQTGAAFIRTALARTKERL